MAITGFYPRRAIPFHVLKRGWFGEHAKLEKAPAFDALVGFALLLPVLSAL